MNDHDEDNEAEFDLIMPFVVCESNGGAYHDDSFCAGFHLGQIDAQMNVGLVGPGTALTVRTPSVPQLDLIAMRYGHAIEVAVSDDEWATVLIVSQR